MSSISEEHLDLVLGLALHAINRANSGDCLPDAPQFAGLKGELLEKLDGVVSSLQSVDSSGQARMSCRPDTGSSSGHRTTLAGSGCESMTSSGGPTQEPSQVALSSPMSGSSSVCVLETIKPNLNTNGGGETTPTISYPYYIYTSDPRATVDEKAVDWMMMSKLGRNHTEPPVEDIGCHVDNFSFTSHNQSSCWVAPPNILPRPGISSFWTTADPWPTGMELDNQMQYSQSATGGSSGYHSAPRSLNMSADQVILQMTENGSRHPPNMAQKEYPNAISQSAPLQAQPSSPKLAPSQTTASSPQTPLASSTPTNSGRETVGATMLRKRKRPDSVIPRGTSSSGIRCKLPNCDKSYFEFASIRELQKHQTHATVHNSSRPVCPRCRKELSRSDSVLRHLRFAHGQNV